MTGARGRDDVSVERVGVRAGYDLWSCTYDGEANPLVALDRRVTLDWLAPRAGERLLDAACGTGGHLGPLLRVGARPVGVDLSPGMLRVARAGFPAVPLVEADLERPLPLRDASFDACLCALVGEHVGDLRALFRGLHAALRPGGRLVFSTFHPDLGAAGAEPHFEQNGTEYRMDAAPHTLTDYRTAIAAAGFRDLEEAEYAGDDELARRVPGAAKHVGRAMLAVFRARRSAA